MGSAGSPAASAGAGAAAPGMPADVISLEVEPDREHLYEDASKWLCLPGTNDELCTTGLDATTQPA
jgi:hypothetical protein